MDPFSLTELASFVTIVVGALGALLAVAFRSKCDTINCCWGGIKCHRVVVADEDEAVVPPAVVNRPEQNA